MWEALSTVLITVMLMKIMLIWTRLMFILLPRIMLKWITEMGFRTAP
uniref:Uncharacterized protein n=1 Tax=Anguilla anguilla TaxID=7936 RepID=A0A0E9TQ02_ANGAN